MQQKSLFIIEKVKKYRKCPALGTSSKLKQQDRNDLTRLKKLPNQKPVLNTLLVAPNCELGPT